MVPGRFRASFELGSGLLVIWGLRARSMLLVPAVLRRDRRPQHLRPAASAELRIFLSREVALLTGMAAAWSPRPDPAFRQRNLVRMDFALGLSWSL